MVKESSIPYKYRYPGLESFQNSPYDRLIFFGRQREAKLLYHKIIGEKFLLLFAKSGVGKTSLLNAALMEPLRENGYIPLSIRFNESKTAPLDSLYFAIDKIVKDEKLDFQYGNNRDSLRHFFSTAEFWSSDIKLLIPVLIFDQFEDFFEYHPLEKRQTFIKQVAELTRNRAPRVKVKIIFSIREDYLAFFEEMSREIPDILQNRFRLLPLTHEQVKDAIEKPASVNNEKIKSKPFKYEPEAVESMLKFLSKRQEREAIVISNEVEPFSLQLLCRDIEEKMIKNPTKSIVTKEILGGEVAMNQVLVGFYDSQLKSIESYWKRKKIFKLCEKGLISSRDRRLPLKVGEIDKNFKVSERELDDLVNSRLLRAESRLGSCYYELIHDTLIKPIRQSQQKRSKQKLKVWISLLCLIFVIILGAFITIKPAPKTSDLLFNKLQEQIKQEHYSNAQETSVQILKTTNTLDEFKIACSIYATLLEIQQAEKEKESYNKAFKENTYLAKLYEKLAGFFSSRGWLEEAVIHYKKAIKNDSTLSSAYINIGNIYLEQNEYYSAIENFLSGLLELIKQDQYDKAQITIEQILDMVDKLKENNITEESNELSKIIQTLNNKLKEESNERDNILNNSSNIIKLHNEIQKNKTLLKEKIQNLQEELAQNNKRVLYR